MRTEEQAVYLQDIKGYLHGVRGHLDGDEGILFGKIDLPVKKAVVCWMADLAAIQYAHEIGADTIICHEIVYYPSDALYAGTTPEFLSWRVNQNRIDALSAAGIRVLRGHMTVDHLCVYDAFAEKLGLGAPIVDQPGLVRVYSGGKTVGAYMEEVKKAFSISHLRASIRNPERVVERIGLPWGGLAISRNIRYIESLVQLGCDLLIGGETETYTFHYAKDSGVDMIETGHELSENPGIEQFAQILTAEFPAVEFSYFETKPAFSFY